MQTLIRLLFQEQSDQGLHCLLPFASLGHISAVKDQVVPYIMTIMMIILGVPIFRMLTLCFFSCLQYLSLPPIIAPYKCSVLPLSNNPDFMQFVNQLCKYEEKCAVFTYILNIGKEKCRRLRGTS